LERLASIYAEIVCESVGYEFEYEEQE